jgi:hypothetical protein
MDDPAVSVLFKAKLSGHTRRADLIWLSSRDDPVDLPCRAAALGQVMDRPVPIRHVKLPIRHVKAPHA